MATVFTRTAAQVPAIQQPAALLNISSGVPTVASTLTAGASGSGSLTTPLNRNAARIDALGRAGGGAYAIDWDSNPASSTLPGLNLTVSSGLTLAIAAGQAVLDSVVQITAPTTVTLADNIARIYLWLSQTGAITQVNNSTTPPAGAQVFLGSVVTSGGAITQIDGSGVCYLRGPHLMRQTADVTEPADTPPAGVSFLNVGDGQSWWWTGLEYLVAGGLETPVTLASGGTEATGQLVLNPSGNITLDADQAGYGDLELRSGGSPSAPFSVTFPDVTAGREWTVANTSGQSVTLIGDDGSQCYMVNNTWCRVLWDGLSLRRVAYSTPQYFALVVSGGTYTFGGWSEVDADHMLLTPSGGNTTVVFPSGGALGKRGRRIAIQNDHTTLWLLIKTGGAPVSQQWVLLPGEIGDFIIDGSGGINKADTRGSAKVANISYPSNADYTVAHPDFLADVLVVAVGSLSSNKALILPTLTDKAWCVVNDTGFTLTVKTSGGTGPTLVTGKAQQFFCDGTNVRAMGGPS